MNCQKARDIFVSYIYEELDSDKEKAFREHLDLCPDCAARLAGLAWARKKAAILPEPEPGRLLTGRILAVAREEGAKSRGGRFSWRGWIKAAAALGATVFVGVFAGYQLQTGGLFWPRGWESTVGKTVVAAPGEMSAANHYGKAEEKISDQVAPAPSSSFRANGPAAAGGPGFSPRLAGGDFSGLAPLAGDDRVLEASSLLVRAKAEIPQARLVSTGPDRSGGTIEETEADARFQGPEIETLRNRMDRILRSMENRELFLGMEDASGSDYLNSGFSAFKSGDWPTAENSFREALAALPAGDPHRYEALLGLARSLESQGDWKQARRQYYLLGSEFPGRREFASRKIEELAGR
ncbi:MAG: tetratricopeptide repeat protein [Pseudomonadota bacterium]